MDEERKSRRADETEEDGRDEAERKGGRNRERRGVRTEKLGRKVRAQDDGALARATDMRPSTSIEEGEGERDGNPADSMAVHFPSPGATYFAKLRSFVRSFPSTRRVLVLFSTTCIRREQRFFQRNRCSNPSFEKQNRHALIELHRWIGLNVR